MKKFITAVPLQPEGKLEEYCYAAVGNQRLKMQEKTSFPIITAIQGYVQKDEQSEVIAVQVDSDNARCNYEKLKQELQEISTKVGIPCPVLRRIIVPEEESVATHANTFRKLIDYLEDQDELFACLTYGTKPLSEAIRMSVQYAYRVKTNVSISCVLYGQIIRPGRDPSEWYGQVYDETALLRLDEMVHLMANHGIKNPDMILDNLLTL